MSNKFSTRRSDHIEYGFWLVFDNSGGVRLTRGKPDCSRNERRISLSATLPLSLFRTPELRATINVPATAEAPMQIDLEAAQEALETALGVDIDLEMTVRA